MRIRPEPPRSVHTFWKAIVNLIFPPRCAGCNSAGSLWCERCHASLVYVSAPTCSRCGRPQTPTGLCGACKSSPPAFESIQSAVLFDGPIRHAIHALKYKRIAALGDILGELLTQVWFTRSVPLDMLVPVPLHVQRQRERGYNQSELLARRLQHTTQLPMCPGALRRLRATTSQMTLDAAQRQINVADAFKAEPGHVQDKRVLLIDDVCTTSATLQACAVALKQAGARAVWGLTLARTA